MDARAKILLTGTYTICLFFIDTALGLVLAALGLFGAIAIARAPLREIIGSLGLVYLIAGLTVIFNAFSPAMVAEEPTTGWIWTAGVFQIGLTLEGLLRGVFFAARLVLIVWASLLLSRTTTATELSDALRWFLRPLRVVGAPVDDIAMILQIAIRFIPLSIEEIERVRDAQIARGAPFHEGSALTRARQWGRVFIPVFSGLFRRADRIALGMDARCYGAVAVRTQLPGAPTSVAADIGALIAGVAMIGLAIVA